MSLNSIIFLKFIGNVVLQILSELCGGVGLFLIGMTLLTDSLKEIAGQTLKELLTRFTATPFKAMLSGLGMTLLVHSSTATIVAAIGFVGAGYSVSRKP